MAVWVPIRSSVRMGDDRYVVDETGDSVIENANEGTDTVFSAVTYSLGGTHVEHLTLSGTAAINGTGNSLANILTGNSGKNTLMGNGGNDTPGRSWRQRYPARVALAAMSIVLAPAVARIRLVKTYYRRARLTALSIDSQPLSLIFSRPDGDTRLLRLPCTAAPIP